MELRHLRYFIAVAEAEHFGKAARQLHVSQSPLSRQIAQLEAELGVALFVPAGRGVKLSPAGRNFLEGARAVLERVNLAVEDARETGQGRIGSVAVGFDGALTDALQLSKIVPAFRARHPRIKVRLVPLPSEEHLRALHDGRISVGYGYHSPLADKRVRFRVLFRDRIGVVLSNSHRLSSHRSVRIADLVQERFIWPPQSDAPRLHDEVLAAFFAHRQTLRVAHEEVSGEALLLLVASGEGVSFFPESAAAAIPPATVFKRVRDLNVEILGRCLWRESDTNDPLVSSLLALTDATHELRH